MPSAASAKRSLVRRARKGVAQTQWFIDEVSEDVVITMKQRIGIATGFLKNKVILNIKKPVVRSIGPRGGTVVERSKPGEFPRADTTQLIRTIVTDVSTISSTIVEGSVGSQQLYSLFLERKLDRSFLVRTMQEELGTIRSILLGESAFITEF